MQRQTPAGTPSPTGTSLRAYLMAYALLSLLPVLGFGAWAVAHYSTAERQSTGQTARWYARELSNNVEHELRRVADQLNRISASRALLAGEAVDGRKKGFRFRSDDGIRCHGRRYVCNGDVFHDNKFLEPCLDFGRTPGACDGEDGAIRGDERT